MNQSLNKILRMSKYSIFNRSLLKHIAIAESNLSLRPSELLTLQWEKLKDMVSYAYANSPFYYEKYREAGIVPKNIRAYDDFQKVPLLTKEEIRGNLERIVPQGIDKKLIEVAYTGGSTGTPLKVYWDTRKKDLMLALFLRTVRLWGCDIGEKTAWVWGRVPSESEKTMDFRYQSGLKRFLRNTAWFNAYDMTFDSMKAFTHFLRKFRPGLIIGYVNALCEYARFLEENAIQIKPPKAIWITAEPSDVSQRALIERALGAKTYNQYGSSEILHIATECSERQGLHIHADSRYVEITDSSGKCKQEGEIGNIVVTDLENRAMPLIRYRNDDLASLVKKQCKCGLNLPLMTDVTGRAFDIIKLKNGQKIYGIMFSKILFDFIEEIRQFQFHQTALDKIDVRIVPGKVRDFDMLRRNIEVALRKHTGNLVDYSIEFVNSIRKERSGKVRYVKSSVD